MFVRLLCGTGGSLIALINVEVRPPFCTLLVCECFSSTLRWLLHSALLGEYAGKVFLARVFPSRETNILSVSPQGSGRICTLPIRKGGALGPMRGDPGQVVNLTVAGVVFIRIPESYVLDRCF